MSEGVAIVGGKEYRYDIVDESAPGFRPVLARLDLSKGQYAGWQTVGAVLQRTSGDGRWVAVARSTGDTIDAAPDAHSAAVGLLQHHLAHSEGELSHPRQGP
jgi:hypothetical protein